MSTATPLSFHDRQHITRLLTQESRVNGIYNRFVRSIAPEMRKWKDANNRNSVWVRNSNIEKFIDSQLLKLKSALETEIRNNQQIAWTSANLKNDELAAEFIKGMALSSVVRDGMFSHNLDALTALQNRVDGGMNLSQRLWKITEQTKTNVELFLESGIATGRSAEAIGRDMRQMLHNPDKRFRRVRNEQGVLIPSQPMKKYNPGRGVYRSARMNALRVAATETNMAYRVSDCERWQGMDFVLGYEVKRSRNGEPCEICDALVGEYPKDFVFSGFHPFCICFAVPILMNHEDFADFLLNEDIPQGKIIKDIPEKARKWIDAFEKKSGKLPMFADRNKAFLGKGQSGQLALDFAPSEAIERGKGVIEAVFPEVTEKVIGIENKIRMNKDFETLVAVDKNGNVVVDKRGEAFQVKINQAESIAVKDCVITHNHPRGWQAKEDTLGRIGNSFSIDDIKTAIKDDVAEIRAVTPLYTFSMKRPKNGWGISADAADFKFRSIEKNIDRRFRGMMDNADTNVEYDRIMRRVNALYLHLVNKEFARMHDFEYTKIKSR